MVLVTKHRADTSLRLRDGLIGDGKLTGAGFYVDPTYETVRVETGVTSQGIFAPYAYLKLSLIDAATLQTRQRAITASQVYTPGPSNKLPWNLLSATQKVEALREVINDD